MEIIYQNGQRHYGAERICGILRNSGQKASFRVVQRIMKEKGLKSSHCVRRQRSLTNSRKSRNKTLPNRLQNLEITTPLQALSSDITYIRTGEGFDYLCQIRDIYTNVVLGTHQQERMTKDLVEKTIRKVQLRWNLPKGTILHSDRGSQYTASTTIQLLESIGWQSSYSRSGKPGDNAWSESFFANLKKEIVHLNFFPTRDQARQSIFEYIEVYYNRIRVQKRLGYVSPIDFLEQCIGKGCTKNRVA